MKRTVIIPLFLSLYTYGLVAQDIPVVEKYEPRSIFKIGTAPIGLMNHSGVKLNFSLAYEFKIAPRLTGQLQLINHLFSSTNDNWDIESFYKSFYGDTQYPFYKKNTVALNADFRYYLGKSSDGLFNGAYLGIRINNLFSNGAEESSISNAIYTKTSMIPAIGFYMGYQKTFKNNMFIDVNAGFVPENQFKFVQNDYGLPLDVNISFGYRFKSPKSKKERKLKRLTKK